MYKINDQILYGRAGICKIIDITVPDKDNFSTDQLYYVLRQVDNNCIIYTPVNSKIPMRPVISAEEVNRLIDMIPEINAEAYYNNHMQELTRHYQAVFDDMRCEGLIELVMSIYAKKKIAEEQNRKIGQIDEKFMKHAEDILYSEFSLALGIPKEKVPDYIVSRVSAFSEGKE